MTKEEWHEWINQYGTQEFIKILNSLMDYEVLSNCSGFEEYLRKDGFLMGIKSVMDTLEDLKKGGKIA